MGNDKYILVFHNVVVIVLAYMPTIVLFRENDKVLTLIHCTVYTDNLLTDNDTL